jgi:transposase
MKTESGRGRPLWTEDPVGRRRMPDLVRASAVRAGLLVSLTTIEAMIAVLGTLADTWLAAPALLCTVVSTVVTTWAVLDVWITWQVWNQRNGVVCVPSGAARAVRLRQPPEVLPGPDVLSGA